MRRSELSAEDLARVKELRQTARGEGGSLSKAQVREIQPSKVVLRNGKLVNFVKGAFPVGDGKQRAERAGTTNKKTTTSEVAALKKQVAELQMQVKKGGPPANAAMDGECEVVHSRHPAAAPRGRKPCHVCGSPDHLKAECPIAHQIQKQEAWLEVLQGEACLLPEEEVARQTLATKARLESLRADAAAT